MRILRENTAALIIDIQERLYPHMQDKEQLADRNIILCQGLRKLNIPILLSQMYTKGLGATIPQVFATLTPISHHEKNSFSCLDEPAIFSALLALQKKFIIIAGIEAHVCVLQSVLSLLDEGFVPVVIADCISSRKELDKLTALTRMHSSGAVISTSESILFELCRYAGNEDFKSILGLIK